MSTTTADASIAIVSLMRATDRCATTCAEVELRQTRGDAIDDIIATIRRAVAWEARKQALLAGAPALPAQTLLSGPALAAWDAQHVTHDMEQVARRTILARVRVAVEASL